MTYYRERVEEVRKAREGKVWKAPEHEEGGMEEEERVKKKREEWKEKVERFVWVRGKRE